MSRTRSVNVKATNVRPGDGTHHNGQSVTVKRVHVTDTAVMLVTDGRPILLNATSKVRVMRTY